MLSVEEVDEAVVREFGIARESEQARLADGVHIPELARRLAAPHPTDAAAQNELAEAEFAAMVVETQ